MSVHVPPDPTKLSAFCQRMLIRECHIPRKVQGEAVMQVCVQERDEDKTSRHQSLIFITFFCPFGDFPFISRLATSYPFLSRLGWIQEFLGIPFMYSSGLLFQFMERYATHVKEKGVKTTYIITLVIRPQKAANSFKLATQNYSDSIICILRKYILHVAS